jgi:transposase
MWAWSKGFLRTIRCERSAPWSMLCCGICRAASRSSTRGTGGPRLHRSRLLRALLLQAFYTVGVERQLMEQLEYNLLFRRFVGLSMDDAAWDATVFCKNRDRLLNGDIACKFMTGVLNLPEVHKPLSSEHFSVDGTLIEAWARLKSFVPRDPSSTEDNGDCTPPAGGRKLMPKLIRGIRISAV